MLLLYCYPVYAVMLFTGDEGGAYHQDSRSDGRPAAGGEKRRERDRGEWGLPLLYKKR